MDDHKNSNKRRKVILKINGTKINQSRTSYSSRQRYLDMSQQKYKPFVVRLGTTDKFGDIQIPQDEEDTSERYRKYFKIKKDMDRLTPKEFQKKYIWGGTRNPTQVKTEKARSAVISRRLRTNYDNFAYLHDVLDISTVSISGDPKLKELSLFCTEDLKQVLNTPLKQLPQMKGNTNYSVVSLISQILADIQSTNKAPQHSDEDDESIHDDDNEEECSEHDLSHLHEEENDNGSDHDEMMDESEELSHDNSSIRSSSKQRVKDVAMDSKEWQAKLNKLKQTR
eukprot:TRINITY_DN4014_c0_g1_i1.p1 TRINITY_DN4014_c0_g1~~TRINITY_DN4014_c0_g1_i1.p1  ORF type:complete len:282 (-),score=26.81 TRINITY_DN4014_c0_g1_i1:88-933(-)